MFVQGTVKGNNDGVFGRTASAHICFVTIITDLRAVV
jgi:hypothetical protein